jgi:peptide/nickel transport system substrate-binding protein
MRIIKSPDAQLIAMQTCEIDALPDLIRTGDIETLDASGFTITASPGFHMGFIAFNVRPDQSYKDSAHGSPIAGPVLSDVNFRHAAFHCYNQEEIVASVYKYIVTPVQSLVPPAQGGWVNPDVPKHAYNPGDPTAGTVYNPVTKANADTCSILRYGGYTWDAGEGNWLTPYDLDGDTVLNDYIPSLRVFTPTYEVAPTSAEHGARFVADCNAVGIPLVHDPREFSPYLDLVFGTTGTPGGEFDLFMVFYRMGRFPTQIYGMCHSSEDVRVVYGADNAPGLNNPLLDEAVATVWYGLDHEEKLDAAHLAQEMLYNPDDYDFACTYMLLYSRIYFNAFKPGMTGIVNAPGYGSDNGWTHYNMRWVPGHANERIEGGNSTIVWCLGEDPELLNPTSYTTVYAADIVEKTLDGLLAVNPYTLADMGWMATDWYVEGPLNETVTLDSNWYNGTDEGGRILLHSAGDNVSMVDGIKITFTLQTGWKWHDGNDVLPSDAEFCLEFMRNNRIPRYLATWKDMIDVQVSGQNITIYNNETSQFIIYDFAGLAFYLPPPVWTPLDGRPVTEILAYDPSTNTTAPTGAGPLFGTWACPTQLYGCGHFVFHTYDATGGYADLFANRNYYYSTEDIRDMKTAMFHDIGDVDRDAEVWAGDKVRYSLAYGCTSSDGCYDADADLNGDDIVDALDGVLINFYWGDKKEYP